MLDKDTDRLERKASNKLALKENPQSKHYLIGRHSTYNYLFITDDRLMWHLGTLSIRYLMYELCYAENAANNARERRSK